MLTIDMQRFTPIVGTVTETVLTVLSSVRASFMVHADQAGWREADDVAESTEDNGGAFPWA